MLSLLVFQLGENKTEEWWRRSVEKRPPYISEGETEGVGYFSVLYLHVQ
jgi:hypothetical protein